jgi:hypothetical protein
MGQILRYKARQLVSNHLTTDNVGNRKAPRTDTFDRRLGLGIGGCAKGMLEALLRQLLREGVRDEVRRVIEE